ncbi:MAG: DUF47 family protein [bacterium]|nr:DUF47 family protein [bacterium]
MAQWLASLLGKKKKGSYFDFFEAHAAEIQGAATLLCMLFDGKISPEEAATRIKEHEHRADTITHEVKKRLAENFIPPIDSEDIFSFITNLDEVIDYIDKAARRFTYIYTLQEATPEAKAFGEIILHITEHLQTLCPLLRNAGKNADAIKSMCVKIHTLENAGDTAKQKAMGGLFEKNRWTASVSDMGWNEMYGILETVTDKAEDCANTAEQIMLKYA